jgi:hypothetical protein
MAYIFSRNYLAANFSPSFMSEGIAPKVVLPAGGATWSKHSVLTEGASTELNARVGELI